MFCRGSNAPSRYKMTAARKVRRGVERAVVGLIPAAGEATRLAPLPCSKELYPIGFRSVDACKSTRPKVAAHYLLEKMRLAGITQIYIVLRKGKWDIPNYFGDGSMFDVNLAYLIMGLPFGPAYSLDQAYPFMPDAIVAFGFPDIVFRPPDAYKKLLRRQATTGADVVLGLFPAREPSKVDVVEVDQKGKVHSLMIKPQRARSSYTWLIAVWSPHFCRFMHNHVRSAAEAMLENSFTEMSVGHVFRAAVLADLYFESVTFNDDQWIDIGTPENLVKAARRTL